MNNKMEVILKIIMIILIVIILLGFIWYFIAIIRMAIDHQCYQLEPNEHYVSTICEQYWK